MLRRLRQVLRGEGNENDGANGNANYVHNGMNGMNGGALNNSDKPEEWSMHSPIKLRSTGYKRQEDGSVTLSVTLDKDQVECCVCFSSMTSMIYRCRAPGNICHNICATCEWAIRRMKNANGHTKTPRCPMCKFEGHFIRNRALERQLYEISIPCKNSETGCSFRHFPWDNSARKIHEKRCMFEPISCPFCHQSIPGGRSNFIQHLRARPLVSRKRCQTIDCNHNHNSELPFPSIESDNKEDVNPGSNFNSIRRPPQVLLGDSASVGARRDEEKSDRNPDPQPQNDAAENDMDSQMHDNNIPPRDGSASVGASSSGVIPGCCIGFVESEINLDTQKYATFSVERENTFIFFEKYGYCLIFLAPNLHGTNLPAWRVFAVSISSLHSECGNNRVYMTYTDEAASLDYLDNESNVGLLGNNLMRPVMNTLMLTLGRLSPTALYSTQLRKCPNQGLDDFLVPETCSACTDVVPNASEGSSGINAQGKPLSGPGNLLNSTRSLEQKCDDNDRDPSGGNMDVMDAIDSMEQDNNESIRIHAASEGDINREPGNIANMGNRRVSVDNIDATMASMSNVGNGGPGAPGSDVDAQDTVMTGAAETKLDDESTVENDDHDETGPAQDNDDDTRMDGMSSAPNESEEETSDELEMHDLLPNMYLAKSPCTPLQCGYIFAGANANSSKIEALHCRVYCLEESLKVGAIIDARDFTGKWYQAEIIKTADHLLTESAILEDTDPLEVRRVRIHYLGYSANYDEWLNVDTDSHRIAQRGTYTVGPDLRAIRRHANQQHHNASAMQVPRMLVRNASEHLVQQLGNRSDRDRDRQDRQDRQERNLRERQRLERELNNSIIRINNAQNIAQNQGNQANQANDDNRLSSIDENGFNINRGGNDMNNNANSNNQRPMDLNIDNGNRNFMDSSNT